MEKLKLKTFYKIRAVILHPGCNLHVELKPETLPHKFTVKMPIENGTEEKSYIVKVEDLWKVKYLFLKRPWYWLAGIKGRYLCIFRSSESGESITNTETKATPVLIRNVQRSRILSKAIAEIFRTQFSGFGRFIIIIVVTGLVLAFAYARGMIG